MFYFKVFKVVAADGMKYIYFPGPVGLDSFCVMAVVSVSGEGDERDPL